MNSKISIIVPVYNTAKFLAKCLDSLINQTYENIEILIVNDGSTDNSEEIISKYARSDRRIKVINQENDGLSSARNKGIDASEGSFLMFVDSDDWINLKTCEKAMDSMVNFNADIVIWSYIREYGNFSEHRNIFDKLTIFENKDYRKLFKRIIGLTEDELRKPENIDCLSPVWMKLYRKEIIIDNYIRFVDTSVIGTEDLLFSIEVFDKADSAVGLPELLSHYRRDNIESLTSIYKRDLDKKWNELFNRIWKIIEDKDDLHIAYNNRIALSFIGLGLNLVLSDKSNALKIRELKIIITSERFSRAFLNLRCDFFPFYWKIFFMCARYKLTLLLYLQLIIMKKLSGKG